MSNLSIIIFDEALHGYYIHGMNAMGQSEGSLSYIEAMFQKESKCSCLVIQLSAKAAPFACKMQTSAKLLKSCSLSR